MISHVTGRMVCDQSCDWWDGRVISHVTGRMVV